MDSRIVVVGADFGDTGDQAIRAGLEQLASGFAQGMHVVYVLDVKDAPFPTDEPALDPDAPTIALVLDTLKRRVSAIAEQLHLPLHSELVRFEVRKGDVHEALCRAASEHQADLLIVGTHGRHGFSRLLAGSISESLVRSAECSVLVARPPLRARRSRDDQRALAARDPARHFEPALLAELREQAMRGEKPWRPTDEHTCKPASTRPPAR